MPNAPRPDDVLQDLLHPGLRLVICGTAAGTRSAAIGAYYAGPGNKFWRILHQTGLTPVLVAPEDWRSMGTFGIGFTDLAKRAWGMDKDLPKGSFDAGRLRGLVERYQPGALAFNGKTAGRAFLGRQSVGYGLQAETIGRTALWVLPSTSGAASGAWSPEPWHALARSLSATARRPLPGLLSTVRRASHGLPTRKPYMKSVGPEGVRC